MFNVKIIKLQIKLLKIYQDKHERFFYWLSDKQLLFWWKVEHKVEALDYQLTSYEKDKKGALSSWDD